MKRTCQYCDSPLLAADTVCWHCGRAQPPSTPEQQTYAASISESQEEPERPLEPVSRARALLYVSSTLVVTLALFLVLRSLGSSPIMVYGAGAPEGEWASLSAPNGSFSVELPATWQWHFLEEVDADTNVAQLLASDGPVPRAVRPLADLVPDITYSMIAQEGSALLVVSHSARLNRLSPQEAAAALPAEDFADLTILEAAVIPGGSSAGRTFISLTHQEPPLHCDQHLVPGVSETYLIATCTTQDDYADRQILFANMLNSFTIPAR